MRLLISTAILLGASVLLSADEMPYDPLRIDRAAIATQDFEVKDEKRSREIPLRVYLPTAKTSAAVVLFSHGLGGTRAGSAFLGQHWASRGYVAVFLQHPGSDDSVWKDVPILQRLEKMKKAAGVENFQLRVKDVPAILDQLERWNRDDNHPLKGRLDLKRVGMSGHSFGAVTTQAISGQAYPLGINYTDPRIKAAVIMSPSSPRLGDPQKAFGSVKMPWLLMTGTLDTSIISDADVPSRLAVFSALPAGSKYELVLDRGEHSAFTERALPGDKEARNPNHHKAILALSTAFWDAHLRDNADARKWLDGAGPRGVLEKADSWKVK